MPLPKRLRILGFDVPVTDVDKTERIEYVGRCLHQECEIRVEQQDLNEARQLYVLWHECLHFYGKVLKLNTLEEEVLLDQLAAFFHMMLSDNPQIMRCYNALESRQKGQEGLADCKG